MGIFPGLGRLSVDMSGKGAPHRPGSMAELAKRQHGVIAAAQLYSLGFSESQVRSRAQAGWLHALHRGVYAVGHTSLTQEGVWIAAVLACGPGAALSHAHAAGLWSLRPGPEGGPIDVTLPTRAGRRRRPGIRVHRPRLIHADEITTRRGI